jgi:hypothetical protein
MECNILSDCHPQMQVTSIRVTDGIMNCWQAQLYWKDASDGIKEHGPIRVACWSISKYTYSATA